MTPALSALLLVATGKPLLTVGVASALFVLTLEALDVARKVMNRK
jgi:hypothetical protein